MTPHEVLDRLVERGVEVSVDGEDLLLSPPEKLTPQLVALARVNKRALIVLIRQRDELPHPQICARAIAGLRRDPALGFFAVAEQVGEHVIVAVACRSGVCRQVMIPAARFDPWLFLETVRRHGGPELAVIPGGKAHRPARSPELEVA